MLLEQTGRRRERVSEQEKQESIPDGWAIDRERAVNKDGEFGARDVRAERVRDGVKRARDCVEVE